MRDAVESEPGPRLGGGDGCPGLRSPSSDCRGPIVLHPQVSGRVPTGTWKSGKRQRFALRTQPVWPGHSCPVTFSADSVGHTHETYYEAAVLTFEGSDRRPSLGGPITGWGPSALERTTFCGRGSPQEEGRLGGLAHQLCPCGHRLSLRQEDGVLSSGVSGQAADPEFLCAWKAAPGPARGRDSLCSKKRALLCLRLFFKGSCQAPPHQLGAELGALLGQ